MEVYKIVVLLSLLKVSQCRNQVNVCSTLFSEDNLRGRQFVLNDLDQSVDLRRDIRVTDSGWNITRSVQIHPGCSLTTCSGTYFDGKCVDLREGIYNNTNSLKQRSIYSARCACPKV